jgi:hypothetical protein
MVFSGYLVGVTVQIYSRRGGGTTMEYSKPSVTDLGSIVEHTFQTPGAGTKSSDTTFELDKWGEHSHPAAS